MKTQKTIEALSWALKETARRGGAQIPDGGAGAPANRRFWLVALRGCIGLALFAGCWLLSFLCGGAQLLAALLGTALVIAAERILNTAGARAEYLLSRVMFTPTGSRDYDAQRNQGLYLALAALRPLAVFLLCWQGKAVWLVPAVMLAGCIELDALEDRPAKPLGDWRAYGYWLAAFAAMLLACGIWGRWLGSANWMALALLTGVLAWLAPKAKIPAKIPWTELPLQARRAMVLYAAETALFFMGVLLW